MEPDLANLLGRLGETVRRRLVPLATDRHLTAELQALAGLLALLAESLPGLAAEEAADRAAAAACLASLGAAPGEDPRAALAAVLQQRSGRLPVGGCRRTRSDRGIAALIRADGPWQPLQQPPDRPSVRDRRERLVDGLGGLLGWSAGGAVEVLRHTEGYAAETVTVRAENGAVPAAVVRVQWPQLPLSRMLLPVEAQAGVLRALGAEGTVAVPRVLAVLDDDLLGAPALVTEFVPGRVPMGWTREGRRFTRELATRDAWRRLVDDLVAIHAVDLGARDLAALHRTGDRATRHAVRIDRLEALYRSAPLRPDPLVEEVLGFLRSAFRPWGEEVLVHGDYRPGNVIYGDGGATTVIDWDGAAVGDHHEDLGVLLLDVHRDEHGRAAGLVDDATLLAGYEERSGRAVVPAAVHYARVLAAFRRCVGFHLIARGWLDGGGDVRMARLWLALQNDRRQLAELLDTA